jgi:hypothetical protein
MTAVAGPILCCQNKKLLTPRKTGNIFGLTIAERTIAKPKGIVEHCIDRIKGHSVICE